MLTGEKRVSWASAEITEWLFENVFVRQIDMARDPVSGPDQDRDPDQGRADHNNTVSDERNI